MQVSSLSAPLPQKEEAEEDDGDSSCQAQDVHGHGTVFAGGGVVVETVEKHLIHHRTDLIVGGLDESETDITRGIFHAVVVTSYSSLGSYGQNSGSVGELILVGEIDVPEPDAPSSSTVRASARRGIAQVGAYS